MQFHTKLKTTSTGNNTLLFIPHTKPKNCYATSIQISCSGSGRIVHLISGAIRFRPYFKNCYPVHPWLLSGDLAFEKTRSGFIS